MSRPTAQFIRVSNEKIRTLVHSTAGGHLSLRDLGLYMMLSGVLSNPAFRYAKGGLQHLLLRHCKNRYFSLHAAWNRLSSAGYLARTRIPFAKNQFRDYYKLSEHPVKTQTVCLSVSKGKEYLASYQPFLPPDSDFTAVSYAVLMDERLSLSAKGLYAVIARKLRLSENCPGEEITKALLHSFCHIGENAFSAVFRELRAAGYLHLTSRYDPGRGHRYYAYRLSETAEEEQCTDKKTADGSSAGSFLPSGPQDSAGKKQSSGEEPSRGHPPSAPSLPENTRTGSSFPGAKLPGSGMLPEPLLRIPGAAPPPPRENIRAEVRRQIEYDCLCQSCAKEKLDCIVSILTSCYEACRTAGQQFFRGRGGIRYPKEEVAKRFAALDSEDIRFVINTAETQAGHQKIHHLRAYLTACLLHAKEDFALSLDAFAGRALPVQKENEKKAPAF